jgi:hypothetical protein
MSCMFVSSRFMPALWLPRWAIRTLERRHRHGETVRAWRRGLLDPYRPELHYMRGCGPKWHAKHDPAERAVLVPALARVRVQR